MLEPDELPDLDVGDPPLRDQATDEPSPVRRYSAACPMVSNSSRCEARAAPCLRCGWVMACRPIDEDGGCAGTTGVSAQVARAYRQTAVDCCSASPVDRNIRLTPVHLPDSATRALERAISRPSSAEPSRVEQDRPGYGPVFAQRREPLNEVTSRSSDWAMACLEQRLTERVYVISRTGRPAAHWLREQFGQLHCVAIDERSS